MEANDIDLVSSMRQSERVLPGRLFMATGC
jgi:hypothetical protein